MTPFRLCHHATSNKMIVSWLPSGDKKRFPGDDVGFGIPAGSMPLHGKQSLLPESGKRKAGVL